MRLCLGGKVSLRGLIEISGYSKWANTSISPGCTAFSLTLRGASLGKDKILVDPLLSLESTLGKCCASISDISRLDTPMLDV